MQQDNLKENCILTIRNGYKMHVPYDRNNRKFGEMGALFRDFGLAGGEVLIFELVDGRNFNLYIVGEDGNEIDYSAIPQSCQASSSCGGKFFPYFLN